MGGVLDMVRGHNDGTKAQGLSDMEFKEPLPSGTELRTSDSEEASLEVRNEKEVRDHPNEVTPGALPGQQKVEAAALVWSKPALYVTYAWIWVAFLMLALQSSIGSNVIYNAYANFASAPQITTAYILAAIIGGVIRLPIAKLLNIWGRAESFVLFVIVYIIGIVVIASSNGPNTYAAGYTLYWIGYDALYLIMDVFVADTTGLKNRAFAWAFVSTPFIITAFVGPLAATSFLSTSGWRWGYGAFAIIMPFVFLPLAAVFKFYQKKAEKQGLFIREKSGRTKVQSIVHYTHEFDVVGAVLLMAAFILFLLPFSLETYGMAEYKSASFITMVVIGILLFPVFAIWEKYFARSHFVQWDLFKQRTVLGACCNAAILYFSFYAWDQYYYSFIYVVYDLNTSQTGYMTQIYNIGSCFWGVIFGLYVRQTKHFKWACLCFGLPLMILGAGLMIHFRGQDSNIGYIVMCQIFIAFGGGTLVIGQSMAVMAAADRDGVPMLLCILSLSSSLGGAIGYAVSAAIYANSFPQALLASLPASARADYLTIYNGGYLVQSTYPMGGDIRNAINFAWGYSQRQGCIAATAVLILSIPAIGVWKNYNVDKRQNKGLVI